MHGKCHEAGIWFRNASGGQLSTSLVRDLKGRPGIHNCRDHHLCVFTRLPRSGKIFSILSRLLPNPVLEACRIREERSSNWEGAQEKGFVAALHIRETSLHMAEFHE